LLVVALAVVVGVIARLRQKLTVRSVVSLGLLITSTVLDLSEPYVGLWAVWVGLSVALCAVGSAAQLTSKDAFTALSVWIMGTYVQAVYEYTLLMLPVEFMRFFSGGYIT
jgi:hypothetical protein